MITRPAGYCPMCDTVYDRLHKCVSVGISKPTPDPLLAKHETALNVYATQIWNEAIEAALNCIDDSELYVTVARLKK